MYLTMMINACLAIILLRLRTAMITYKPPSPTSPPLAEKHHQGDGHALPLFQSMNEQLHSF